VTQELALEPVQFIARTDAVLRLGSLMGAGASSARVRDSMVRAADAVGIDDVHCRVGMTDIAHRRARSDVRTRVAEVLVRPSTPTADGAETPDGASAAGHDPAQLQGELREVERMPRRYPIDACWRPRRRGLRAAEQRRVAGVRRRRDRGGGRPVGADAHPPPAHERVPARVRLGDDGLLATSPPRRCSSPSAFPGTARRGTDQRRALLVPASRS
jgi:hypothetical protein